MFMAEMVAACFPRSQNRDLGHPAPGRGFFAAFKMTSRWMDDWDGVQLFVAAWAGHEVFDGGERVFALMQDGVDLLGDGHFDVMALGQR